MHSIREINTQHQFLNRFGLSNVILGNGVASKFFSSKNVSWIQEKWKQCPLFPFKAATKREREREKEKTTILNTQLSSWDKKIQAKIVPTFVDSGGLLVRSSNNALAGWISVGKLCWCFITFKLLLLQRACNI